MLTRHAMVLTRSMLRLQSGASSQFVFSNDVKNSRFAMELERSDYAHIDYRKSGNLYVLEHTNVPPGYQGRGIGKIIAKKTFDWIVERKAQMRLECEFLQSFYESNKSTYADHVVA